MSEYRKKYADDVKPIAVCPLTNWGGVCIMEIQNDLEDYVVSAENYGEGYKNVSRSKIRTTTKGEAYFMRQGKRWHIRDFQSC